MKFKQHISKLAFLLVIATLFMQCGGNEKTGSALEKAKARGKEIAIRRESAASTLNPLLPTNGYSRFIAAQLLQTLGITDPETDELQPLMINKIPSPRKVTEGKYAGCIAYDFEMNPLATWDNGTPITGKDVELTVKLILHPGLPTHAWRSYFSDFRDLEIDPADPKKFTFYFSKYYFLALETICQIPIYAVYNYDPKNLMGHVTVADLVDVKKAVQLADTDQKMKDMVLDFMAEKYSINRDGIVGSTAYKLDYFEPDQVVTLVRKQNWWGDKASANNKYLLAPPEKLTYKTVKDEETAINMLRSGDLDLALTISAGRFVELQKDPALQEAYEFKTYTSQGYNRLLMNTVHPILSDVKVRQALSYAVDYDYLVKEVQHDLAVRILSPVGPTRPYVAKDIPMYNFDLEKAKSLLTAAGWADSDGNGVLDKKINGKVTEFALQALALSGNPISEQISTNVQSTFKKIGVKIDLAYVDLNKMTQLTTTGKFDMCFNQSALQPGWVELYQGYHSSQLAPKGDNRSRISLPELDKAIEMIRYTEDPAARTPHYIDAQRILHEYAPEIYLHSARARYVISKRLNYNQTAVPPGYYEQYFSFK